VQLKADGSSPTSDVEHAALPQRSVTEGLSHKLDKLDVAR
jgi:hypothetical protein